MMYVLVKKSWKIGPVDPKIIGFQAIIKNKEISEAKCIAEQAKQKSQISSLPWANCTHFYSTRFLGPTRLPKRCPEPISRFSTIHRTDR